MSLTFNLENMTYTPFESAPEMDKKKWSYCYVYHLRDLKDIYLLYYLHDGIDSIPKLFDYCQQDNVMPENGKKWTKRNLLELVNALKNFNLLSNRDNKPLAGKLFTSNLQEELNEEDKNVLREIYYNYFRFQEFLKLFTDKEETNFPVMLYAYMENSKYFNRFIRPDTKTIYYIDEHRQDIMRFWDVYTKWGTTLNILNKCSLKRLNPNIQEIKIKNCFVLNIIRSMPVDFSIYEYLDNEILEINIYIPSLEWELIRKFGYSIEDIKQRIIEENDKYSDQYRLQRTSEIFVEQKRPILYPIVHNTYMSHILKL